jgi:hypothetical protein
VIETTLTLPDPVKPRFCRIVADGGRLVQTSWTGGGRPRETVKALDTSDARFALDKARTAFDRARTRKMREGFCDLGDPAPAGVASSGASSRRAGRPSSTPFTSTPTARGSCTR